jgi:hypothetical protein
MCKCPKKRLTITPEQEKFIRENFGKIKRKHLPDMLGITKGKLDANLHIMKGLPISQNARKRKDHNQTSGEYFDIKEFAKYYSF